MMIFLLLLQAMSRPVFSAEWDAQVVTALEALVGSCVVIPCTFTYPGERIFGSKLTGMWFQRNNRNDTVFDEDKSKIAHKFRGRTKLMGRLGEGDCTLEMTDVKDYFSGALCFQADIPGTGQFTFLKNCASLKMLYDPPKPTLTYLETASPGDPYTITCSITHTCPSHMPTLTWSRSKGKIIEDHKNNNHGRWEMQSILTFIPEETDDHSKITCTATFNGGSNSSENFRLFVKRTKNHRHIIVPTLVGIGIAVVFGAACILMMKKYKKRIAELQNSGRGSMWSRLSRMSRRIRSGGEGRGHVEQRSKMDMMDFGAVHMPNDVSSATAVNQKINKPRFPSPKCQPRSNHHIEDYDDDDDEADYTNTADLNIYGNL